MQAHRTVLPPAFSKALRASPPRGVPSAALPPSHLFRVVVLAVLLALFFSAPGAWAKDKEKHKDKDKNQSVESIQVLGDSASDSDLYTGVCPAVYGGANNIVDTVSSQVDGFVKMRYRVDPPNKDEGDNYMSATYKITTSDATIMGIALTPPGNGTEIEVTVPAGAINSDYFWVRGVKVGTPHFTVQRKEDYPYPDEPTRKQTYAPGRWEASVWDTHKTEDIVDYNALGRANVCYDPVNSPALNADTLTKTKCGKAPDAVAADGSSRLLMRLKAGMKGTACFKIVDGYLPDPGLTDPLNSETIATDLPLGSDHWAFGTYLAPKSFGVNETSREVEVEIAFTPDAAIAGRTNTTYARRKITIKRPPVVLVHGVWSNAGTWSKGYTSPTPTGGWLVGQMDYSCNAGSPCTDAASFSNPKTLAKLKEDISKTVKESRGQGTAATKVDIVAHSMGGLVTRTMIAGSTYRRPDNFQEGDVRRLVTLTTPHWGSQFANLLINLHNSFAHGHKGLDSLETFLSENIGADVHRGAVCDLAENSPALAFAAASDVNGRAYSASEGPVNGSLHFVFRQAAKEFQSDEKTTHIDPYAFLNIPNDALVSVASQQDGLPSINYTGYIHFTVPWYVDGYGITGSLAVARAVYLALDGEGGFSTLPKVELGIETLGDGTPRVSGRGRGAAVDRENYTRQCVPGGPLRQP
jgi:pimeloyl-ACP methyl ester carboxylesterase